MAETNELYAELVGHPAWEAWLNTEVTALVREYRSRLLMSEDLSAEDRQAMIRVVKQLRDLIRRTYTKAGLHAPHALESWLS